MNIITTYRFRAVSADALWAMFAGVSAGRPRGYAWEDDGGVRLFDEARVRLPWPETAAGESVEEIDPDTGEVVLTVPQVGTGLWLGEIVLVDEEDAGLAAIAESVSAVPASQAASG